MFRPIHRVATWLGLATPPTVIGLHLGAERVVVAALRPEPVQLLALARELVFDAAIVDDDVRLVSSMATEVAQILASLRLRAPLPTVVVVEPPADTVALQPPDDGGRPRFDIDAGRYRRAREVVERAGLDLVAVDIVPVALGRLGLAAGHGDAVVRSGRWTVTVSAHGLHGSRAGLATTSSRPAGPGVDPLAGVRIPPALRADVDPAVDAGAIGAALAAFGWQPLVQIEPVATDPGRWTVDLVQPRPRPRPPTTPQTTPR